MAAVPGGNKGLPRARGRSMLGGVGGQGSRPAGVTTKVRFSPPVYAGGGTRGAHIPGSVPDKVATAAPSGLAATPGNTQVALDWNDVTTDDLDLAAPYQYRYGTTNPPVGAPVNRAVSNATVTGLINDTVYRFQVRTKDDSGNFSAWSAVVSSTPVAP